MKRSSWNLAIGSAFSLLLVSAGCNPDNKVTPGAPVLLKIDVVTPAGAAAELVADGGAAVPAPPLSQVYALFDRILDPLALETLDSDGGISAKDGVATVQWSGGAIPATTSYFPNGSAKWSLVPLFYQLPYNVGPSISVIPTMGLPSGAMVTVNLVPDKVRSHDQKTPFKPSDKVTLPLTFTTEPLAVTIDVPVAPPPDGGDDGGTDDAGAPAAPPAVAANYGAHVTFNNLTPDETMNTIHAAVTVAGAPVVVETSVERDATVPAAWVIAPKTAWPAGAVVTVTVDAAATDNFQIALGAAATATFTVMQ